MSIRAIFFDFGGVLYKTPGRHWLRQWQKILGLEKDETISAMIDSPEESPYVLAIMEGRIPESDMWDRLGKRWRLSPYLSAWLRRSTMSKRRLNREVADFLASLRPQFRTGILSNAGSDARRQFTEIFGFDRIVDEMIISAEEGVAKPDERIYRIALDRLGVEPQEAVFLDDLPANVAAARRFGMQAVQFQDTRQAIAEVKALITA